MSNIEEMLDHAYLQRLAEFLNESVVYSSIHRMNFKDKSLQHKDKGYYGAAWDSLKRGYNHQSLSSMDLLRWQEWIDEEVIAMPKGRTLLTPDDLMILNEYLVTFNGTLSNALHLNEEIKAIEVIADQIRHFYQIHLYSSHALLILFLLANYMAAWFDFPLFVFHEKEHGHFIHALNNFLETRKFFAKKRREAIFDAGHHLMVSESEDALNTVYRNEQGHRMIVQWNEFIDAQKAWEPKPSGVAA